MIALHTIGAIAASLLINLVVIVVALRAVWKRREAEKRMRYILVTDLGTNMPNRYGLMQTAEQITKKMPKDERAKTAFVIFRITWSAAIVAAYGREAQNEALGKLCALLQKEPWVLAAGVHGGAAQVGVFTKAMSQEILLRIVRSVMRRVKESPQGSPLRVPLSTGICFLGNGSIVEALENAAAASSTDTSEGQLRVFDKEMRTYIDKGTRIRNALRDGFKRQEFKVWYQPKYDLVTRKCVGAEALCRWDSRALGFLMPGAFVSVCERTGYVIQLDYYMLGKVFAFQKARRDAGKKLVTISVNQSRVNMQTPDYIENVRRLVQYFGSTEGIEIELTETALDFEGQEARRHAEDVVNALHSMGFTVSMDDFGTGYSDISLLATIPIDVIKIDRTLLTASESSKRMQAVLSKVTELAKDLGMQVLCEGVETKEQEALLLNAGCQIGQGFIYAKPMPEEEFAVFLDEHA